MTPYITLQYLLFPTALFLAKAVWGAITTTHIKSTAIIILRKTILVHSLEPEEFPFSGGISEMGTLKPKVTEAEEQEAFSRRRMQGKEFRFDCAFWYE